MDFFTAIALMIVSAAISYALQPKPEPPKPSSLEDIKVPTAELGKSIPVIFGTVVDNSPNVVSYGNLRTEDIKK